MTRTGTTAPPGPNKCSGSDIAQSIDDVPTRNSTLPASAAELMVESGWVTQMGDVDWQCQRLG